MEKYTQRGLSAKYKFDRTTFRKYLPAMIQAGVISPAKDEKGNYIFTDADGEAIVAYLSKPKAKPGMTRPEFSKRTGIPVGTLKDWAKNGTLVPAIDGKFYSEEQIELARRIRQARQKKSAPVEDSLFGGSAQVESAPIGEGSEEIVSIIANDKPLESIEVEVPAPPTIEPPEPKIEEVPAQKLENLPDELLSQPRFFEVGADKVPHVKDWGNPDNQKICSDVKGLAGFDTTGHDRAADYALLDFDHVRDDNGQFINPDAQKWFEICAAVGTYCEQSISGSGLHLLLKPTKGKFDMYSGGSRGTLYFDKTIDAKLEIFHKAAARYCLLTGKVFACEPKTPIVSGEVADDIFQKILDEIASRAPVVKKSARTPEKNFSELGSDYDSFRADLMLDAINPADLPDSDWLAVMSACKNIGIPYNIVDAFNSRDPARYNEKENQTRWDSLDDSSFNVETLHGIAKRFGYSEAEARRQWYQLHPDELSKKKVIPIRDDYDFEEKEPTTADMIAGCPVALKVPEQFIFEEKGLTLIVPPKKDSDEPKYICVTRTPLLPTRIFREPTKNNFSYEIAILVRGVWLKTEIEGKTLADPRAIIALAGTGALIDEPKILCRFLNAIISLNPNLTEMKAYSRTGWTDNSFKTFVYPYSDEYIVRRAGFDFEAMLATRGDAELWRKKFVEVMNAGGAVAAMYLGTALAAVLARPFNIMNPQTHLQGTSGSGKTALQKFASSIFGDPRKLKRTFATTNKNRLVVADAFCDLPSFLDELETIQGKAAEEALSNDIYNYADGKGNQANKRNGDARETFEFGGSRVMTGERPLLKEHDLRGAYKRLIQLEVKKLFEDEFAAELHIFSEQNFGHFGRQWIQFATEHMPEIVTEYQRRASRRDPTTKPYEPTHLKSVTAALVAFEFFKVMLGGVEKFDGTSFIRNWRAIVDILPTVAEMDDTGRALAALSSYVASHEKSFMHDETSNEKGKPIEIGTWGTTCSGKIFDDGAVAFHPTELKRILEDELHFASANKLIADWYECGILKTNEAGRKTYKIRIGTKTYNVHYFKAGIISSSNDSAESSYYEELSDMG